MVVYPPWTREVAGSNPASQMKMQKWRNGKRTRFRIEKLGVRISLPVLIALLAQMEEASDLKSVKSKFESWVEYNNNPWCNGNTQDFDSCIIGSNPIGLSKWNSSKVGLCVGLKIRKYRFEPCLFH